MYKTYSVKDPLEQFLQKAWPSDAAYCPTGHGSHSVSPSSPA